MPWLLIVVFVLVVYFLSFYVKPIGKALAFFCCLAGSVLVQVEHKSAECSAEAKQVFRSSPLPERLVLLAYLLYFTLAVLFLLGETYHTWLALPALFPTASPPTPPGWLFQLASSALFLTIPTTFGAVILEMIGVVDLHQEGLFPNVKTWQRFLLGLYSFLFFVVSIVVMYEFWKYRAGYVDHAYRAAHQAQLSSMALYVIAGLGLLVAGGSFILFRALTVGGTAVISIAIWLVSFVWQLLSFAARVAAKFLERISVYFGAMSPYDEVTSASPQPHTTVTFDPVRLPSPTELESEASMPAAVVNVLFMGSSATSMVSPMSEKITEMLARFLFRTSAVINLADHRISSFDAGKNIGISHPDIETTLATAMSKEEAYATLFERVAGNTVEEFRPIKGIPSLSFLFIDPHCGAKALKVLPGLKNRLPLHTIAIVTSVHPKERENRAVTAFFHELNTLHENGIVAASIVLDPLSPFARKRGEEKQGEFLSQTLTGLLLSSTHSKHNSSAMEVLEELGGFVSLSFASNDTVLGQPAGWFLRFFTKKAVTGDLDDMLRVARGESVNGISIHSVTDPTSRAIEYPIPLDRSCTWLTTVPLPLSDKRFSLFEKQHKREIKNIYPLARTIVVAGNGLRYDDRVSTVYRVSLACLYPLPDNWCIPTVEQVSQPETTQAIAASGERIEQGTKQVVVVPAPAVAAAGEPEKLPEPETMETPPPPQKKAGNGRGRTIKRTK